MVGAKRYGRNINGSMVFGPDVDDTIPFSESVDWLRQFYKEAIPAGYYILVGRESNVEEIWHGEHNDVNRLFTCVYVAEDEGETE